MKLIQAAAAVLNQTPLDWRHNSANVRRGIQMARDRNVVLLCLPELCLTGYGCEDAFHSANTLAGGSVSSLAWGIPPIQRPTTRCLDRTILPAVEPQPVEARTLCAQLPPRR